MRAVIPFLILFVVNVYGNEKKDCELHTIAGLADRNIFLADAAKAYDAFKDCKKRKVYAYPDLHERERIGKANDKGEFLIDDDGNIIQFSNEEFSNLWKKTFKDDYTEISSLRDNVRDGLQGDMSADEFERRKRQLAIRADRERGLKRRKRRGQKKITSRKPRRSARKKGRNITIFVSNHGGNPWKEIDTTGRLMQRRVYFREDRKSTSITMPSNMEDLTIKGLEEILNEQTIQKDDQVRLIGTQCYSGALHDVSFKRKNTCSASVTEWSSISYYHTGKAKQSYAKSFLHEIKAKGHCSTIKGPEICKMFDLDNNNESNLIEAHLAGVARDSVNKGRGQLSSMAYIDMLYEQGAYSLKFKDEIFDPRDEVYTEDCIPDSVLETLHRGFERSMSDINNEIIEKTRRVGAYNDFDHRLSPQEIEMLPGKLKKLYSSLVEHPFIRAESKRLESKMPVLQKAIDRLYKKRNSEKDLGKRNEIDNEIRNVRDRIAKLRGPLKGVLQYLKFLKKVKLFYSDPTISESQKKHFENILNCEFKEF